MIHTQEQYNKLAVMADTAEECLSSLKFGSHWLLRNILRQEHGVIATDSASAIRLARQLCDEWLFAETVAE
jgi:hypothetical protein